MKRTGKEGYSPDGIGAQVTIGSAGEVIKGNIPFFTPDAAQMFVPAVEVKKKQEEVNKLAEQVKRLRKRVREILNIANHFRENSTLDPLTQIPNRRAYNRAVVRELERAKRTLKPLSLLFLDIDHFKKVNDTHGHSAGDYVLQQVAQRLSESVRLIDLAARYGGEEFVVVLPQTSIEEAKIIAERIRSTVERMTLTNQTDSSSIPVTVSIGVECSAEGKMNERDLKGNADAALYEAKESGRNRVVTFTREETASIVA